MTDVGAAYRGARERISELVRARPEAWEQRVPHCPEWTLRQLVAHLTGIVDDAVHGNMSGVATSAWTAAQVAKRADATVPEILGEWASLAPMFEEVLTGGGTRYAQPVFDVATHEHDVRSMLGVPGARRSDAVVIGTSFVFGRDRGVQVVIDGMPRVADATSPLATLRCSWFDALRTFGSRRTRAQVLALDWDGDPTPVLDAMTPFGLPDMAPDEARPLDAVVALIAAARPARGFTVVGIGGHGGSGKSTLARAIIEEIVGAQIIATDAFWTGSVFDLDRLRTEALDPLLAGRAATFSTWDWAQRRPGGMQTVTPSGVVVVEGVCALHQMFRDDEHVRIWVDAPAEVRLARGVARDGEAMRSTWTDVWMPNETAYVERDRPIGCAHLVLDGRVPY
jgi:uridine kinase